MSKTCHDCIWEDECDLNNLVEYIRNQIDSETMLLETCSDARQKKFHQGRLSAFESMLEDREGNDIL